MPCRCSVTTGSLTSGGCVGHLFRALQLDAVPRILDAARERHGRLRPRFLGTQAAGQRHGALALGLPRVVGHQLPQRALERRSVDELTLLDDGLPQGGGEVTARREPFVAGRRERPQDQRFELGRDVLGVGGRGLDDAGAHDVEQRLAPEPSVQRPARQDLPEHDAQGVEVAAPVDSLAARLLGRHVAELALEDPGLLCEQARAGDAEVGDLHRTLERQQDVLGADVAVDDVERLPRFVFLLVRVVQALGRLGHHPRGHPWRHPGTLAPGRRHEPPEVTALDVLHGQEQPLVAEVLELVDLHDVGVVQTCGEVRLLDEHRAKAPRAAVCGQDALEHEQLVGALGSALLGQEHFGHAAGAQAAHDLEVRDLRGRGRRGSAGRVGPGHRWRAGARAATSSWRRHTAPEVV